MSDTQTTSNKNSLFGTVFTVAALAGVSALAYARRAELTKLSKDMSDKMAPMARAAGALVANGLVNVAKKMDPMVATAANDGGGALGIIKPLDRPADAPEAMRA